MDDRTRALLFTSGLVSDLRKEVLKEYPKKILTAIRLARKADESVELLSSMDNQTTVGNGRNEQAPSAADGETSRHDQRGQVSRFGGRRRLTNNYSRRSDASVVGKLAILLEIVFSPTETQTASAHVSSGEHTLAGNLALRLIPGRTDSIQRHQLLCAEALVGGHPARILLDTGASHSFVSQSWKKSICCEIEMDWESWTHMGTRSLLV